MPGFSSIVGGLAKAAVDQLGNKVNQQSSQNSGSYNNQPPASYNNPPYNQGQSNYNYQPFQSNAYPSSQPYDPNQQFYPPAGAPTPYNYSYDQHPPQQIGFNTGSSPYPPNSAPGYPSSTPYPPNSAPGYPTGQSSYPSGMQQPSSMYPPVQPNQQLGSGYGYQSQPQFSGPRQMYSNPSIKPYPHFNAQHDADSLRNAMKGFGCNRTRVIEILCQRSNAQRQDIARTFKTMYGKDLVNELRSELHGDFEELILALMENPVKYDADQLYKAMARIGTRENVLIEIMTSRSNVQIFQLKQAYAQVYGRDLERDLVSETSGYFARLLVSMCAGGRDESNNVDPLKANQDARRLYNAGERRLGTDEAQFSAILAVQNFNQLRLVFDEYQKVTNHSIEQAINAEFSGDIRDGLHAIIKSIRNRPAFFAELLHNSMKGFGTRDTDLIRIIVTRSEVDLADIRNEYGRMYGTPLESAITGDCSGAYKDGLIALVKGN